MKYRVTIRGEGVELRGWVEETSVLYDLQAKVKGIGIVVASLAADDYNPFKPRGYDGEASVPPEWAGQ